MMSALSKAMAIVFQVTALVVLVLGDMELAQFLMIVSAHSAILALWGSRP